jgi:hypothetical protein
MSEGRNAMKTETKEPLPLVIIYLTSKGVARVRVPFRSEAEKSAGRALEAKVSSIISLLSRAARGSAAELIPLPNTTEPIPQ